MSLDKFISRGYSGSLGGTSGQWVSRTAETPKSQPINDSRDSGTSFVLGGGRSSTAGYRAKSNRSLDASRSQNVEDILHRGTQHRRDERRTNDLLQNCFGGSSRSFDESDPIRQGGYPIQKIFRLVLFAIGVIGILYLVFSWPQSSRERVRALREQQVNYGYSEE